MYRTAVTDKAALAAAEEARMARAATTGDGTAFATLYERYEKRVFNLAYRITGSEADAADAVQAAFLDVMRRPPHVADGELTFGHRLFAATHRACHGLIGKRAHSGPGEAGLGAEQVGIREASLRLPERQREVLALHDLEDLSYDEIGEIMEVSGGTVAQLISRARINLCDEMLGTSLASVAAPSAECGRALPLIATRDDGQLEPASGDVAWLDAHLAGCRRCRAGVEAMQEADASYRAWAPIAAVPWLFKETLAKAATLAGVDWSGATTDAAAAHAAADSLQPDARSAYPKDSGDSRSPRRMTVAAGLAALLLLGGVAAIFAQDDPSATTADSAGASAGVARIGIGVPAKAGKTKRRAVERKPATRTTAGSATTETETISAPVQTLPTAAGTPSEPDSHSDSPGGTAVNPTHQISDPTAGSKPEPAPTTTPAPQATETPAPEEAPAAEEASGKGPHGHEKAAKPVPLPIPVPIPKVPKPPGHPLK
jgi:RNA polymerase sigma-70 factor (ECF subfamily)